MTPAELAESLSAEEALASRLQDEFPGYWVAVRDLAVIASALTLNDLLAHVETEEVDRIIEVAESSVSGCFY